MIEECSQLEYHPLYLPLASSRSSALPDFSVYLFSRQIAGLPAYSAYQTAIYVKKGSQSSLHLSQHSRSMLGRQLSLIDSITGLDLTRTNVVCGATALPSVGAHFVIPVHYLGHLSNTDVGQLRWLTCERCCVRQQLTIWLNLTTAMFSKLGVYWGNIATQYTASGLAPLSPDCAILGA